MLPSINIDGQEARAIRGFPGYYITEEGRVFSCRKTRNGKPKERTLTGKNKDRVGLTVAGVTKQLPVSELLQKAWK